MIRQLEHVSCENSLRELGWSSMENRRLWGYLRAVFQHLKGAKKLGKDLTRVCGDSTRGTGFKLKKRRFRLYIKKKCFPVRMW